ncbi:MAG: hypothetical protein ACRDD8_06175 [Bacteroidales bacterium]
MATKERMKIILDSRRKSMSEQEYKKFESAFLIGVEFGERIEQDRAEELKRKQEDKESNESYWFVAYNFVNSNKTGHGISSVFLTFNSPEFILNEVAEYLMEFNNYSNCVITNYQRISKAAYDANINTSNHECDQNQKSCSKGS